MKRGDAAMERQAVTQEKEKVESQAMKELV
jgi:hypothetical protein